MADHNLKISDVLPADMQTDYPDEVLNCTVEEAINIAKYSMPPTSDLSEEDVEDINEIYNTYMDEHVADTDSAYWNKTPDQNEAYWSKTE